jgi:hypothetical protein
VTTDIAVDSTSHLSHISANAGLTPTHPIIIKDRRKGKGHPNDRARIPLPDHRVRALNGHQEIAKTQHPKKRTRDQDVTRATTTRDIVNSLAIRSTLHQHGKLDHNCDPVDPSQSRQCQEVHTDHDQTSICPSEHDLILISI